MSLDLLLLIGAAICFALVTLGVNARINLTGLGLFLWVLTAIV
jgi:hypothetical protein